MKRKLSLTLALMLSAVCLTSLGGCGKKNYGEFLLGSWVAYCRQGENTPSMAEQTARLKEAGLNFIIYGSWADDSGAPLKRDLDSLDWWKYVDGVMVENGMKYMFSSSAGGANTTGEVEGSIMNDSKRAVERAKRIVPELKNCIGYMVKDEPWFDEMDQLKEYAIEYAKIQKGRYPISNMFPSGVDINATTGPYKRYLEWWIKCVGAENLEYISYDSYPFYDYGTGISPSGNHIGMYQEMEAMRQLGIQYNLKTHAFPQACSWQGRRMPTFNEIRWHVNSYLAYGFKALSYFNYNMWQGEGCFDAIIDLDGNIKHPDLWEDMKKFNLGIRATSDIIMSHDCIHAYHTRLFDVDDDAEIKLELLPDDFILKPVGSPNLILSYFKPKGSESPYLMITNKSFTEGVSESFTLGGGLKGLEYFNPESGRHEKCESEDGLFTVSLAAGEGKFFRLKGNINIE